MQETIIRIEQTDSTRIDVALKGDKHSVINMMVQTMEKHPEVAETIIDAAIVFMEKNRYPKIIKP